MDDDALALYREHMEKEQLLVNILKFEAAAELSSLRSLWLSRRRRKNQPQVRWKDSSILLTRYYETLRVRGIGKATVMRPMADKVRKRCQQHHAREIRQN